jgi:hypothetical protein
MLRMTEGSVFVAADDEINEMGVDCTTTKGGIPLFGPITNLVAPDWKSRFTAVLNTTITDSVRPLGNFPFSSYTVTEAAAYGEFAIGIASDREVGKSYTFTAFLRQTIVGGSVRITQMNNEANYMTVNLRDGSCTFTGTGIIGTAFVYPSGIIRVAFGFTTVSSMNPNLVKLTHIDDGASTPARNGTNRALFTIARPMISTSFLNHPTLEDEYTTGSTSVLTLALERIPAALALSDVMIAMSINMYPALPNQAVNDTTILSFGTLSITRADAILSVKNGNTVLFQQPILPGLNNLALSYSPTEIIFKSGISPRKVLTGAFPALLTQTVTVGRCGGYLRQMAMYAASDKAKAIEYLANG